MGVLDACTNNLRESAEKVGPGGWELVTANQTSIIAKSLLYAIVVKESQGNRRFPDSTSTDDSDRAKVFHIVDDILD